MKQVKRFLALAALGCVATVIAAQHNATQQPTVASPSETAQSTLDVIIPHAFSPKHRSAERSVFQKQTPNVAVIRANNLRHSVQPYVVAIQAGKLTCQIQIDYHAHMTAPRATASGRQCGQLVSISSTPQKITLTALHKRILNTIVQ